MKLCCDFHPVRRKAVWGPKRTFAIIFLFLLGFAPQAFADKGDKTAEKDHKKTKLDFVLRRAAKRNAGTLDVIVRVVPGAQDAVRKTLEQMGDVTGEFASINAFSATIDASELASLDADPLVLSVSVNAVVKAHQLALASPLAPA